MLMHGLKEARVAQRLSREELATRAGLNVPTVKRLEQGVGSIPNLVAVMAVLDFHLSGLGRGATISQQAEVRRKTLGLSLKRAAKLAGISPTTLSAIERGQGTIAPLMKVLRILGTGQAKVSSQAIPLSESPSAVITGDALQVLCGFATERYQTCITSPPYFGHRDYGIAGQLGRETLVHDYVSNLVNVFREVRRVLRSDGTLFLVVGDTYQDKRLLGVPWRLALALQDDGWILRQDIIWSKPNPMPEPVRDRCVRSHEYVFLLSKTKNYLFDPHAIRERGRSRRAGAPTTKDTRETHGTHSGGNRGINNYKLRAQAEIEEDGFLLRNKRSVWEVQVMPSRHGHYATFPEALVQTCLLAASRPGDLVLDPFAGTGTTAVVAKRLGRVCHLIELNPEYARTAALRLA